MSWCKEISFPSCNGVRFMQDGGFAIVLAQPVWEVLQNERQSCEISDLKELVFQVNSFYLCCLQSKAISDQVFSSYLGTFM